jgi:hypothetical protein
VGGGGGFEMLEKTAIPEKSFGPTLLFSTSFLKRTLP